MTAVAAYAVVVWTVGLYAATRGPDVRVSLGATAPLAPVASGRGLAFLALYGTTVALALGLARGRWWAQPLAPLAVGLAAALRWWGGGAGAGSDALTLGVTALAVAAYLATSRASRAYFGAREAGRAPQPRARAV